MYALNGLKWFSISLHCPCILVGSSYSFDRFRHRFWSHTLALPCLRHRSPFLYALRLESKWINNVGHQITDHFQMNINQIQLTNAKDVFLIFQNFWLILSRNQKKSTDWIIHTLRHSMAVPAWCWNAILAILIDLIEKRFSWENFFLYFYSYWFSLLFIFYEEC